MDPDANLLEQEKLEERLKAARLRYLAEISFDGAQLMELRQALYDWVRGGGFEPDWTKAPISAKHYGK